VLVNGRHSLSQRVCVVVAMCDHCLLSCTCADSAPCFIRSTDRLYRCCLVHPRPHAKVVCQGSIVLASLGTLCGPGLVTANTSSIMATLLPCTSLYLYYVYNFFFTGVQLFYWASSIDIDIYYDFLARVYKYRHFETTQIARAPTRRAFFERFRGWSGWPA
jgi:hypothetical protein